MQKGKTMDDVISRQAAIRWVKTECNPYGKPTLDFESGKKVIEHLKQMPSAQADVIRCKECKYYHDSDGCFFSTAETIEDGFCNWAERRTDGV